MLPMYPILSAIILGRGALPLRRAFLLSLAYVQGMALTYTLLGLAVASMGASLQAWLQQPLVLVLFSLLFIVLAAAMFGAFSLCNCHLVGNMPCISWPELRAQAHYPGSS